MVSEKHDNVTISYWISQWQRSTSEMGPKIGVTDASLALIYANQIIHLVLYFGNVPLHMFQITPR